MAALRSRGGGALRKGRAAATLHAIHRARGGLAMALSSDELFKEASWFAVMVGQGHEPKDYNPLIDSVSSEDNLAHLRRIKENIRMIAARMRDHLSFLS